ncbi:MAG: DUF3084 domain-containing protein [Selenomonadaceae bacterium]|nr:DUF3084 domain-containing protein [Selenomonadaceae bacterium]
MEGIYLIIVMIITGGAIAFIGDKLGTKIGKKRLSIFGLRPRHTSMVITVITGALITGLSIGSMAIISENVRTALFGMEELNATMAATEEKLGVVTQALLQAQVEYERANADLETSKKEIDSLKTEQTELIEESERLKSGNERLESENSDLAASNSDLEASNSELAERNDTLAASNSELSAQNENLSSTNAELETANRKLGEFNVTLTADNEKLSKDNAILEEHARNLREGLIAIREGDIILKAGEILSSGTIQGNRSDDEIRADIERLAEIATRNIAERFGGDFDGSVWIYEPEVQDTIKKIAASNQEMILRISAAGNLVRGEPIRASLSIYPNNPVYAKDELVFAGNYEIKNEMDAEPIVREFLSEVNRAAVAKGILTDPITHAVGVMEGSQLYELIDELSDARGKVKLTAYARDVTKSIGPLRLNIKVTARN